MENKKGFTLIELMISIAIIGILAVVLMPRVAGLKSQSKLAGLDTNIRIAASYSQKILVEYDKNSIGGIEKALADRIDTSNDREDMMNPISKKTGCIDFGAQVFDGNAFGYFDDADEEAADSMLEQTKGNEDFAGAVLYDVYIDDDNKLKIKFVPFDEDGNPIKSQVVEVTQ